MRLILMRHAKSDWSTAVGGDHERPLNTRGTAAALALGNWLREVELTPDLVLCSSSQRTRDTLSGLRIQARAEFLRSLYLADPQTLHRAVQDAQAEVLLVIAHNPGIAEFAHQIVESAPAHDRFRDYPTGATLVVDLPPNRALGSGKVRHFVIPREL